MKNGLCNATFNLGTQKQTVYKHTLEILYLDKTLHEISSDDI